MRFNKQFIVVVALLFCSCKQTEQTISLDQINRPVEGLTLNQSQGILYDEDLPFSGFAERWYPTGQLASSIQYLKGRRHGTYTKYFQDGRISYQANYTHGKMNGEAISYWNNGNMRSKAQYKNGIADGIQEQWYSSGAPFKRMHLVNGQEEGLQQSWRENGSLYNNYEAKNGRIFGLKRAQLCYELEDEELPYFNQ